MTEPDHVFGEVALVATGPVEICIPRHEVTAMLSKRLLIVSGAAIALNAISVNAQQPLPRPIVLYRSVQNTTLVPQANQPAQAVQPASPVQGFDRVPVNPAAPGRGPVTITTNPAFFGNQSANVATPNPAVVGAVSQRGNGATTPASQNGVAGNGFSQDGQAGQTDSKGLTPDQQWIEEQRSRPTLQAMQNPSAPQNFSHSGFTYAQQRAPNNYLGSQFDNWTNQQPINQMPASFGEMGRMQPGPFGGYVGPNTFMGTGFESWTNMTQGGIGPGATGSWDFSIWP